MSETERQKETEAEIYEKMCRLFLTLYLKEIGVLLGVAITSKLALRHYLNAIVHSFLCGRKKEIPKAMGGHAFTRTTGLQYNRP